jgi:hypothetical protein
MAEQIENGAPARLMAVLAQQAGIERALQHQVWREEDAPNDRARPMEFDTGGFPIPQQTPRFLSDVTRPRKEKRARARVRRVALLGPSPRGGWTVKGEALAPVRKSLQKVAGRAQKD